MYPWHWRKHARLEAEGGTGSDSDEVVRRWLRRRLSVSRLDSSEGKGSGKVSDGCFSDGRAARGSDGGPGKGPEGGSAGTGSDSGEGKGPRHSDAASGPTTEEEIEACVYVVMGCSVRIMVGGDTGPQAQRMVSAACRLLGPRLRELTAGSITTVSDGGPGKGSDGGPGKGFDSGGGKGSDGGPGKGPGKGSDGGPGKGSDGGPGKGFAGSGKGFDGGKGFADGGKGSGGKGWWLMAVDALMAIERLEAQLHFLNRNMRIMP